MARRLKPEGEIAVVSAGTADHTASNDSSGGAAGAASSDSPPRKKKRSEMGEEERKLMRKATQVRSEKLSADIDALLEEQEELLTKYAEKNDISVERIKKLVHQVPSMKPQKKASDYNILVYFKGKELNTSKLPLPLHLLTSLILDSSSGQGF